MFSYSWVLWVLCIYGYKCLLNVVYKDFLLVCVCPFIPLIVGFAEQKFKIFQNQVYQFFLSLILLFCIKNWSAESGSPYCSPLHYACDPFSVNFCERVRPVSRLLLFFCMWMFSCSSIICWTDNSFFMGLPLLLCQRSVDCFCMVHI